MSLKQKEKRKRYKKKEGPVSPTKEIRLTASIPCTDILPYVDRYAKKVN
tara:strand:- start:80 stop:226 length:147 start_codon:yes stop_codon:yes gene_type:complete